jgi:hypothetical protein
MEEENQRKHRRINLLIPKLLEQSNKFTKVFKDKKKIDNIFTEFEKRSSKHFKVFIKESSNRYKTMKVGNNLDKLITSSEKNRLNEVNRVLTDNFFSDEGIKKEKEKSKFYNSGKQYDSLKMTFRLLKESESDTSKTITNRNANNLKMKKIQSVYEAKESIPDTSVIKELLDKGMVDLNGVFRKDQSKIVKMFDKYREDVKTLQKIGEESQEKYAIVHKKLDISLPKLEMINYVHYEPPKNIDKDMETLQKNTLDKIIPFTTSNYNIKSKSLKRKENLKLKNILKTLKNNKSSLIPNNDNNSYLNKNLKNTNDIVYNTAYKELSVNNALDEKRKRLNKILGYDVPKLANYKNIIRTKFNEIKKNRNNVNIDNLMYQKYASMTYFDRINMKINNELYQLTQIEKDLFEKRNKNK